MTAQKSTTPIPALTYNDDRLHALEQNTFRYFWKETNPEMWRLMRSCPYVETGLLRAGFKGGWLTGRPPATPAIA
jgi:hypothetical protein